VLKTLPGDTTCTLRDHTLLAEFSAKLLVTDTFKKMRIESLKRSFRTSARRLFRISPRPARGAHRL
jgi:hypothetical protein